MAKIDAHESEVLTAYEAGALASVATKDALDRISAAARARGIKDRRVSIRLSSGDLRANQVAALKEGMPCQTLIASILHEYVIGRLVNREVAPAESPCTQPTPRDR